MGPKPESSTENPGTTAKKSRPVRKSSFRRSRFVTYTTNLLKKNDRRAESETKFTFCHYFEFVLEHMIANAELLLQQSSKSQQKKRKTLLPRHVYGAMEIITKPGVYRQQAKEKMDAACQKYRDFKSDREGGDGEDDEDEKTKSVS
jgi:hypothetical protein